MKAFRKGQRITCIDAKHSVLIEGKRYTVLSAPVAKVIVRLTRANCSVPCAKGAAGEYWNDRFR